MVNYSVILLTAGLTLLLTLGCGLSQDISYDYEFGRYDEETSDGFEINRKDHRETIDGTAEQDSGNKGESNDEEPEAYQEISDDDFEISGENETNGHSILSRDFHCTPVKYRTFTGRCNNLKHPEWGMRGRPCQRLVPAEYSDGSASPKTTTKYGYPLPLARRLSVALFPDQPNPDYYRSLMIVGWGYFITNDISWFKPSEDASGPITCCDKPIRNKECFPVEIPKGDILASPFGGGCMEYVRSKSYQSQYGKREQLNRVSSFIDASQIYGKNSETSKTLRVLEKGLLATVEHEGKSYMPFEENKDNCLRDKCYKIRCGHPNAQFYQIQTALHTIFVREHNRLANIFFEHYPDWDDETIFQEARRFVIASIQRITYRQYLPSIFGKYYLKKYNVYEGDENEYDETMDPTVLNEFGAAAIQALISAIHGVVIKSPSYNDVTYKRDIFNKPEEIWLKNGLDAYLTSYLKQAAELIDPFISKEFTSFFMKKPKDRYGSDALALNIQRGRDHGLPPYLKFRSYCRLRNVYQFSDLYPTIPHEAIRKLKYIYRSVHDIDLFVGGLLERREFNGIFGPTFTCIILTQLKSLKLGDRFWYENQGQPSSFEKAQIEQIRDVSLARIICNNANSFATIQRNVFFKESMRNILVACNDTNNLPNPVFAFGKNDETYLENNSPTTSYVQEPYQPPVYKVQVESDPYSNANKSSSRVGGLDNEDDLESDDDSAADLTHYKGITEHGISPSEPLYHPDDSEQQKQFS